MYRRFNNAALGESETADSLFFVEKIRKEYLMDEWNKNLTDKNVDYAGIWNKEKADGKLGFIVDTAWVNRGNGDIKPQYLISVARNDQAGTRVFLVRMSIIILITLVILLTQRIALMQLKVIQASTTVSIW